MTDRTHADVIRAALSRMGPEPVLALDALLAERDAATERAEPPTKVELREVIAAHVRDTEPFATSDGIAAVVHDYLRSLAHG